MKLILTALTAALLMGGIAQASTPLTEAEAQQGEAAVDECFRGLHRTGQSMDAQRTELKKLDRAVKAQEEPGQPWIANLRRNLAICIDALEQRAERIALTKIEIAVLEEQVIDERYVTAIDKLMSRVRSGDLSEADFMRLRNLLRRRAIAAKQSVRPDFEYLRAGLANAIDDLEERCHNIAANKRPGAEAETFEALGAFKLAYLRMAVRRTLQSMRTRCRAANLPPSDFEQLRELVITRARAILEAGGEEPTDMMRQRTSIDALVIKARDQRVTEADLRSLESVLIQSSRPVKAPAVRQ